MIIEERASTHVYRQKRMFTKEELEAIEHLCVHEQPPYCNAACPLKLDTKAMVAAIAAGDFDRALALYDKVTPFPHILCAACEAPCEGECKLCEIGEGISIRELEKAALRFGTPPKKRGLLRKKNKKAAVFGADLFSLFLAGELCRKMYPVTVFCREEGFESFVRACVSSLPEDIVAASAQALSKMDISFVWNTDPVSVFHENSSEFDLLCAAYSTAKVLFPELSVDEAVMVSREQKLITGKTEGVLGAAFGAKKAALSADRLAQNLDPANTRGEEGSVETRLYTSLEGVTPSGKIPCTDRDSAIAEAQRCIQCRCEECIKGCAYLRHYKKFPRILTREVYNNVSIIMGDHMMNKPINACSLCGQCSVLCPNGYDMAKVCHLARQNMVTTDKMPLAPHEFALMDMVFSNDEAFLCRPQPGFGQCKYVFFPGCQATAIAPATVRAAYLDLCQRLDGGVALMLGCCGAICDWAGRYEMYDDVMKFLDENLEALGNPTIIAGCPTCKKQLSSHENLEIHGIWEVLEEIGLPEKAKRLNKPIAVHDACGARGDGETQASIRRIAERLGCQVTPTPYDGDKSPCCGYGGLTQYTNREVAKEMTESCLQRSDLPYLSYCMACRDRFAREGRESMHLLELVYGTSADHCPDISAKRYNRLSLKNQLLEEIWNEEVIAVDLGFTIEYTPEAEAMMDDRMILKTDVVRVLQNLRETGEAIRDEESGLLLTRARLGNVTFWVRYEEIEGGYRVHRAYSHRMNIVNRL
ncbi:MAG: heterodisulfide reductase-related iron-sulfur binding cluster [Eubacteriales bacterium]|nr:heterodisulfide reductase-related iron-sulfur binding cluster [Eubacteriales bacterium]